MILWEGVPVSFPEHLGLARHTPARSWTGLPGLRTGHARGLVTARRVPARGDSVADRI